MNKHSLLLIIALFSTMLNGMRTSTPSRTEALSEFGWAPSARPTIAEIKKQYHALALKFHPDKNSSPEAIERFKRIGNAYNLLQEQAPFYQPSTSASQSYQPSPTSSSSSPFPQRPSAPTYASYSSSSNSSQQQELEKSFADFIGKLPTAINIDNLVIEEFSKFDAQSLITLAQIASQTGKTASTSIVKLYIFKELTKNPTATLDDLSKSLPANAQNLKNILEQQYPIVKSSAGREAIGTQINHGHLTLYAKNCYGLMLIKNREKITSLHFSSIYELTNLQPGVFQGFGNLQELQFALSTDLQPGVLEGLTNLKTLVLTLSKSANLQPEVFQGLEHLNTLNIIGASLNNLNPEIFKGLTKLQELALTLGDLQQPEVFQYLTNLRKLTIFVESKKLQSELFKMLTNLKELFIESDTLTNLEPEALQGLTNLKILKISIPQLKDLDPKIFAQLPLLIRLVIHNNIYLDAGIIKKEANKPFLIIEIKQ